VVFVGGSTNKRGGLSELRFVGLEDFRIKMYFYNLKCGVISNKEQGEMTEEIGFDYEKTNETHTPG
jgi:hypothetical protein